MSKIIYFIRHGETFLNAKSIRQGPEGSLSDKGVEQANITGRRLENNKFDVILASPYERTRETAEIIQKYVDSPIEYINLLTERRNPSEIVGRSANDLEVAKIVDIIDKSFHEDNFRYSDEENFSDLKERAKNVLDFIAWRKEEKVLVITHYIFLEMVVAYMTEGDKLTASKYNTLRFLNRLGNASITICEYKKDSGWKLLAWDDEFKV